jgi:hypothetical protein
VADKHDGTVTYVAADVIEIVGVGGNVDTRGVVGKRGPAVPSIIPMAEAGHLGKVIPEVLPNVPITADPVRKDRRQLRVYTTPFSPPGTVLRSAVIDG